MKEGDIRRRGLKWRKEVKEREGRKEGKVVRGRMELNRGRKEIRRRRRERSKRKGGWRKGVWR